MLTINRGRDSDQPVAVPGLKTDAAPLRFIDFLLKESVQSAVLSKMGVLVDMLAPERHVVRKLIVVTMRPNAGSMISALRCLRRKSATPAGASESREGSRGCLRK